MKRDIRRKLLLRRDTIRILTPRELDRAGGAAGFTTTFCTPRITIWTCPLLECGPVEIQ